jgi:uncharacterized protein (TIGR03382 family)/uncharacterized repeat protein (TIGR01451 family)
MKKILTSAIMLLMVLGFGQAQSADMKKFETMSVPFIENDGSAPDNVAYFARISGGTATVSKDGTISYALKTGINTGVALRESLIGAESIHPAPGKKSAVTVNSFRSQESSAWRSEMQAMKSLNMGEIYSGITMELKAGYGTVEKIFHISTGGNPSDININLRGQKRLIIKPDGSLDAETVSGMVSFSKPVAFQTINGQKIPVEAVYSLTGKTSYGFKVGSYDKNHPLVIDPMVSSTLLGGSGYFDEAYTIAEDSEGNIYVAGYTSSNDFPTTDGAYRTAEYGDSYDAFISKFDSELETLIASAYIGGNNSDYIRDIALDSQGNVYITGDTRSSDFPATGYSTVKDSGYMADAFVTKLSGDLTTLIASTYLGADMTDVAHKVAIDDSGDVFIAGSTGSFYFPITNGGVTGQQCGTAVGMGSYANSGFIAKFSSNLSELKSSTCIGGYGTDNIYALALDADGSPYVAGYTHSTDFYATAGTYAPTFTSGSANAFIMKLDNALSSVTAMTFLNGNGNDVINDLKFVPNGTLYASGYTVSTDFPTTLTAYKRLHTSGAYSEIFVSAFTDDLSTLTASTLVGASDSGVTAIDIGDNGNVYVAGATWQNTFPVSASSFQQERAGENDAVIATLSGDLTTLKGSTYLGYMGRDAAYDIIADSGGDVIVTGFTGDSYGYNRFPTVFGAYMEESAGGYDAFVSRFDPYLTKGSSLGRYLNADLSAPDTMSPGRHTILAVDYYNGDTETASDTVLTLDIPSGLIIVSIDNGGVYRSDTKEIFWKLGDLAPRDGGTVTATIEVPAGYPTSDQDFYTFISASNMNDELEMDIDSYLDYSPLEMTSETSVSVAELTAVPAVKALYDKLISDGMKDYGTAKSRTLSDGRYSKSIYLYDPTDRAVVILSYDGKAAAAEKYSRSAYSVFDLNGGMKYNKLTGETTNWGTWGAPDLFASVRAATNRASFNAHYLCLKTCAGEKLIDWTAGQFSRVYDVMSKTKDGAVCIATQDPASCGKAINIAAEIPFVNESIDAIDCVTTCINKPEEYYCEEDKYFCGRNYFSFDAIMTDIEYGSRGSVYKKTCEGEGHLSYFSSKVEDCGTKAYNKCGDPLYVCGKGACQRNKCIRDVSTLSGCLEKRLRYAQGCSKRSKRVSGSHDPNDKQADIEGDIIPGQELNYTIRYENVGEGTAYGVFVIDQLSENLDETTLVINNGGEFNESARVITWDIGDLPAGGEGSVTFSVSSKDMPQGTKIYNKAVIYFPSANEETPTNTVVNTIQTVTAETQEITVQSGSSVAVTLTGASSASGALTYTLTEEPKYGSLTGSAPSYVYTPMADFSGYDEMYFKTTASGQSSAEARILIYVEPSDSDYTAPQVVETSPTSGASDARAKGDALPEGGYYPMITAVFSEAMDESTITSSNFTLSGVSGAVSYDAYYNKATFIPSAQLDADTEYTAQISSYVKDASGNSLDSSYTWKFRTRKAKSINVVLPGDRDTLEFGTVDAGTEASSIISIFNNGTEALSISSVTVSGDSSISAGGDNCTGAVLETDDFCNVEFVFAPASEGDADADVSVASDSAADPVYTFAVTGSARTADIPSGGDSDDSSASSGGCSAGGGGTPLFSLMLAGAYLLYRRRKL